jgi:7-carboxy-7-deazaguanine synthase
LQDVPAGVIKIVDVKCPGSSEGDTFYAENLESLTPRDEVKFVICDRRDYDFARDFTIRHDLTRLVNSVLFSPAFSKEAQGARDASNCLLDPQELADWILEDNLRWLRLAIHKLIWDRR